MNDHQAFAPARPPVRQQDPQKSIQRTQAGATSSVVLQHPDWMAQRDNFQHKCGAVRSRRATTGSARFPGIAMKLAYPKPKPPLNLADQVLRRDRHLFAISRMRLISADGVGILPSRHRHRGANQLRFCSWIIHRSIASRLKRQSEPTRNAGTFCSLSRR